MRIIILEDDPLTLKLYMQLLETQGYEVIGFENPKVCPLQMIPECRCKENEKCADLIITDLEMPEMHGFEFLENHRNKQCKSKDIIIISGYLDDEAIKRAKELGCKIFEKPPDFNELIKYIEWIKKEIKPNRRLKNWIFENLKH